MFPVFRPDLNARRTALEQTNNIFNMHEYASAWLQLADEYLACGYKANAGTCHERGNRYAKLPAGEYVRWRENAHLVEFIEVPECEQN